MKKLIINSIIFSTILLVGCNSSKKDADVKDQTAEKSLLADWSCTAPANLDQIQNYLKDEYLKALDKNIRHSEYQSDLSLLDKIKNGIRFEIRSVTTLTQDPQTAKELECDSQLIVHLPKGLQERAENAFLERPCEECDGEYQKNYTLHDALESKEFQFSDNQLSSQLRFTIIKTDKEGLSLNVPNEIGIIDGIVAVSQYAAEYEAYVKVNKKLNAELKQSDQQNSAQTVLAQKAMDIRNKELESDRTKMVEQLNQAWESLSVEQHNELKQAQAEWFEKRDVDCKVLAQKTVYSLSDSEKETYQKHYQYWNDAMNAQNERMQYIKCFNSVTEDRIHYLNEIVK